MYLNPNSPILTDPNSDLLQLARDLDLGQSRVVRDEALVHLDHEVGGLQQVQGGGFDGRDGVQPVLASHRYYYLEGFRISVITLSLDGG